MAKLFNKARKKLVSEEPSAKRTTNYLKYAIGEILLVVVGILIALQINIWNEDRKERLVEINYLKNLKADLLNEIDNNEYFTSFHFKKSEACSSLLSAAMPSSMKDVQVYTDKYELVFSLRSFVPNNNTFKELLGSGNLSLIKNDSIKNGLLELEKRYALISMGEYHMRREYEEYLYDVHVKNISALEFFDITKPKYGSLNRLKIEDIAESKHDKLISDTQWQYNNQTFNNGLKLAMMNNSGLANEHKKLVPYIHQLVKLVDKEMKK